MPEITFAASPVPMKVASKVLGMKPDTIRNQMERGMLQIGVISPAKHKRGSPYKGREPGYRAVQKRRTGNRRIQGYEIRNTTVPGSGLYR